MCYGGWRVFEKDPEKFDTPPPKRSPKYFVHLHKKRNELLHTHSAQKKKKTKEKKYILENRDL